MRMNICSCLLVLVLGCNVTAEIIHQIVEQEQDVTLHCPHSVEGKLTWSREINGSTDDILTVDGDRDERFNDPDRRYSSLADKSLLIHKPVVSDSGKYLCNNEPAVELTVIPSGTTIVSIAESSSVTLTCPHDVGWSHVPTWSREIYGEQEQITRHVSAVDKYLNIPDVQPDDSGLYYCDGKPAANLNVTKGDQSEREENRKSSTATRTVPVPAPATTTIAPAPPTTTSTTTTTIAPAPTTTSTTTTTKKQNHTKKPDQQPSRGLVLGIVVPFLLVLLIITVYCAWRCRSKRRGVESSGGPSAEYCMATFPGGSNQNEPTYCTMPDPPPTGSKIDTSVTESPYSMITNPLPDGSKTGTPQLNDPMYSLLEKPKVLENND